MSQLQAIFAQVRWGKMLGGGRGWYERSLLALRMLWAHVQHADNRKRPTLNWKKSKGSFKKAQILNKKQEGEHAGKAGKEETGEQMHQEMQRKKGLVFFFFGEIRKGGLYKLYCSNY